MIDMIVPCYRGWATVASNPPASRINQLAVYLSLSPIATAIGNYRLNRQLFDDYGLSDHSRGRLFRREA